MGETTTIVCAPSESIQMAKYRGQTAQQRFFVSFPLDPTVTPCSGAAARRGKALKTGYRLSLPLSDRKQHHV